MAPSGPPPWQARGMGAVQQGEADGAVCLRRSWTACGWYASADRPSPARSRSRRCGAAQVTDVLRSTAAAYAACGLCTTWRCLFVSAARVGSCRPLLAGMVVFIVLVALFLFTALCRDE